MVSVSIIQADESASLMSSKRICSASLLCSAIGEQTIPSLIWMTHQWVSHKVWSKCRWGFLGASIFPLCLQICEQKIHILATSSYSTLWKDDGGKGYGRQFLSERAGEGRRCLMETSCRDSDVSPLSLPQPGFPYANICQHRLALSAVSFMQVESTCLFCCFFQHCLWELIKPWWYDRGWCVTSDAPFCKSNIW